MTSATGSLNAFFDTLPRTRVAIQGRELRAFRCCGIAGFYAAVMVSAATWWRRDSDHPLLLAVSKS
jgi:hypothetical protein